MAWRLDPGLVRWAFGLTKDVALPDGPKLAAIRPRFASDPQTQAPPRVFIGASLGSVRFWHGARRTEWARDWVKTWTDGQGVLAMTAGEEQSILDVLTVNGKEGRVDARRVLILRTASNYSREGDGEAQTIAFADGGAEAGFEAAWRVGAPVVKALVAGWPKYADTLPGARP
jgi:purine nucleoside permease